MLQLIPRLASGLVQCSSKRSHFLRGEPVSATGVKVTGFEQLDRTLSCSLRSIFKLKSIIARLVLWLDLLKEKISSLLWNCVEFQFCAVCVPFLT